jgi:hypothetical protein
MMITAERDGNSDHELGQAKKSDSVCVVLVILYLELCHDPFNSETCLNQTLNKTESCIKQTLNKMKVPK